LKNNAKSSPIWLLTAALNEYKNQMVCYGTNQSLQKVFALKHAKRQGGVPHGAAKFVKFRRIKDGFVDFQNKKFWFWGKEKIISRATIVTVEERQLKIKKGRRWFV